MARKTYKSFVRKLRSKDFIARYFMLLVSSFIIAINYNVFLLHNDIVAGGLSGIAIVLKNQIDPSTLIFCGNLVLLVLAFFLLGKKYFKDAVIGALLVPLVIRFTSPLVPYILEYVHFDNIIITLLISGILDGLGYGFLYKYGFSSGGSDIINAILAKYLKIPTGRANLLTNTLIIGIAAIKLGLTKMIYGIIIIYIGSLLIDRIMIGISDSKLFFVHTTNIDKVKDFIITELNCGVTLLDAKGGYLKDDKEIIMCVVPNKDYIFFKEVLLQVDPSVFFVISDCYEVSGGVKRERLPFI